MATEAPQTHYPLDKEKPAYFCPEWSIPILRQQPLVPNTTTRDKSTHPVACQAVDQYFTELPLILQNSGEICCCLFAMWCLPLRSHPFSKCCRAKYKEQC